MSDVDRENTFFKLAGFKEDRAENLSNLDIPYALAVAQERLRVQVLEIIHINTAADAIEAVLEQNGFSRPAIYSILTAGMDVPQQAILLGKYGEEGSAFASFPKTDIFGHSGEVYAFKVENDQTMFVLKGRAHSYEWSKDPYGDMVVAHPLQVMKELARRGRAESGLDPIFIFTYLTGVREDQNMKPGDLGIILDDTPGDNDVHPGHGPRALLDQATGERFQPKDGRASTLEIATLFSAFAKTQKITIFPAAAIGTPGTTEYQSSVEAAQYDNAFFSALCDGNFGEAARQISTEENAALLFCMGVTSELAAMRQIFSGEKNFKVLALGLATDSVGGKQSTKVNHDEVVAAAFVKGKLYRDLIISFINSPELSSLMEQLSSMEDHSIKTKIENL